MDFCFSDSGTSSSSPLAAQDLSLATSNGNSDSQPATQVLTPASRIGSSPSASPVEPLAIFSGDVTFDLLPGGCDDEKTSPYPPLAPLAQIPGGCDDEKTTPFPFLAQPIEGTGTTSAHQGNSKVAMETTEDIKVKLDEIEAETKDIKSRMKEIDAETKEMKAEIKKIKADLEDLWSKAKEAVVRRGFGEVRSSPYSALYWKMFKGREVEINLKWQDQDNFVAILFRDRVFYSCFSFKSVDEFISHLEVNASECCAGFDKDGEVVTDVKSNPSGLAKAKVDQSMIEIGDIKGLADEHFNRVIKVIRSNNPNSVVTCIPGSVLMDPSKSGFECICAFMSKMPYWVLCSADEMTKQVCFFFFMSFWVLCAVLTR